MSAHHRYYTCWYSNGTSIYCTCTYILSGARKARVLPAPFSKNAARPDDRLQGTRQYAAIDAFPVLGAGLVLE